MNRYSKPSKYKNAFPHVHKKEKWINDLKVGANLTANGNHIKASCDYIAFVHDSTSVGTLAILPVTAYGRFTGFPMVVGHSANVTDFDFSPFSNQLLATGSDDCTVKLWNIPNKDELIGNLRLTSSLSSFGPFFAGVNSLLFHPSADNVLAVSSKDIIRIFDIHQQTECFELDNGKDVVEGISWHGTGHLISAIGKNDKEKSIKIFDPRASKKHILDRKFHNGQKHSSILFLSDTDRLVSAGFNKMREAELVLWDSSNLSKPICQRTLGTNSSGSPSVLYDSDSKMLFAAIKSETSVSFFDCSVSLEPGQQAYHGSHQTKGIAMVPKRAIDVMSCEVVRLLQLTQNSVVPISYHVQRKSYSEFHADLYPDTSGATAAMSAEQWLQGSNAELDKVSLDPRKLPQITTKGIEESGFEPQPQDVRSSSNDAASKVSASKGVNIVRSSKFRHIEGKLRQRSSFINKIPALSSTVPGDSNAFQANRERVAAVLSTSGGQVGVFELNKSGRLDNNSVPTLQNGSAVMDFAFDPFDTCRIVVSCEDAKLRVWTIPTGGLTEVLTEPKYLIGHQDKANVLQFHPQAKSLLASSGYDCRLILWDLSSFHAALSLDQLTQPLFCMAWSPNGNQLATFAKDHVLSIFEPRSHLSPVSQMEGPIGSRGARLVWLEDSVIAVSGFNKTSVRTINLYSTSMNSSLSTVTTTESPAILVPYFDVDTKLLFLTGKGDNTIHAYEYVKDDFPHLFPVTPFNCGSSHQAVAFLPKALCDVTKVEIEVGLRLTRTSVEGFTFHVPRTRLNYFQDDIYPNTALIEEAALSVEQWLKGENAIQKACSMKPHHMKSLSDAPKEAPAAKKFASYNPEYKSDEQKKEELMSAMIDKMGEKDDDPLPQGSMDGADSDEWSD